MNTDGSSIKSIRTLTKINGWMLEQNHVIIDLEIMIASEFHDEQNNRNYLK